MPTTPWDPMRNNNKKIQNESTAFPGITKDAEAKILATAEKQGKTQYERNLIANDLYKVALKEQNTLNFINERTGAKQELYQKSLQSKDKNQSNRLRTTERTAEVADMIRNYSKTNGYGDLDQWEDIDIINGFTNENKATRNEIEDYINGEESAFSFSNRMGFGAGDNRSRFDMITRNGGEWNDDILGHFETESYDNADNKVGTWFKNLGKSTYNLASDLTNMVVNPVDTIGNLTKAAVGGVMNLTGLDDNVGDEGWFAEANQVADGMGDFLKDRYGGKEQILNTFYQDPAGLISDIASIVAGGAGLAKGGATAVAKTAATTGAKSVARNAGKVANVAGKVMRTANNLDPATMILKGEGKIAGGAYKGAKGVVNAVTSPIETGKKVLNSAGEGLDKIGEYGARKITGTTSAQDKLYKAQEPRMNILTRKKDLEKRRANSDRANELIVEYGYKPTDTASRLTAHEATMKKIWNEVEKRVNNDEAVGINQSQLAEKLYEYIKDQKKLGSSLNKADIAALEREMKTLNGKIVDLPTLEKKKQLYNSIINNWGESKVSDVFSNGLKVLTHEIGKIEDSILAEIPGEFQKLKNDFGALKDTYEDVFKADMKNQRKKGLGLVETYSRLEGLGDIASGVLSIFNGGAKDIAKGAGKLVMGKALAKARDVDFLVKEGFEDLYNTRKGLAENQVSSKTAKYQVADESGKQYKQYKLDGKERADYEKLAKENKLYDREQTLDGLKYDIIQSKERGYDISEELFIQRKVAEDGIKRIQESIDTGKGYWVGGDNFVTDKAVLNKLMDEKKKIIDYIDNFDESKLKEYNGLGLSKEKISQQINSKEFKDFIGDSIAKNTDGTPKDLYHGTTDGGFTVFDINRSGRNANKLGPGIYLSNEPKVAREYTKHMNQETGKLYKEDYDTPEIMKVYARLENPLMIDKELIDLDAVKKVLKEGTKEYFFDNEIPFFLNGKIGLTKDQIKALPKDKRVDLYVDYLSKGNDIQDVNKELLNQVSRAYRDNLEQGLQNLSKATGKDGVFFEKGGSEQYVLWNNSQVKSATDNIGTFDRNNPDIRYQKYGMAGSNEKEINATKGLNIRNFKNGKTVQQLADQYGIKTKIVDKISTPEGQKAYGVYGDRMITLAKDLVESTVPHELLHATFDMVDTAKRKSLLDGIQKRLNVDDVQAEEWLADNFSEYYRTGKFDTKAVPTTLAGQIKQFFQQIKEFIDGTYANRKEITQLFDDIIDGKIEGEYGVYSDPKFQSVRHGSSAEFDRFDSSHMGEGEGNQVHGWGHYVAVNKNTSKKYANLKYTPAHKSDSFVYKDTKGEFQPNVYSDKKRFVNNILDYVNDLNPYSIGNKPTKAKIKNMIKEEKGYLKEYIKEGEDAIRKIKNGEVDPNDMMSVEEIQSAINRYKDDIKTWDSIDINEFEIPFHEAEGERHLYSVDIPDPKKADTPTGSNYLDEFRYIDEDTIAKFNLALQKVDGEKALDFAIALDKLKTADGTTNVYGEQIYDQLSKVLGSDKEASKFLESLGYDGIHYFGGIDGEAYVIFNDDALKINKHEKY